MRVLVWIEKLLERSGGPPTYVFNLKKSVIKNNHQEIVHFYPDLVKNEFSKSIKENGLSKRILDLLPNFLRVNISVFRYLILLESFNKKKSLVDFEKYDFIHFHSTVDVYRNRNNLRTFNGSVILTPHSPKVFHLEIIEDILKVEKKIVLPFLFKKLVNIDLLAFSRADILIFPCEGAMEPYLNTWKGFDKIVEKKDIRYLLTATSEPNVLEELKSIRKKYNIPNEAFLVIFAGRHNSVKGFDVFKEFGELVLKEFSDVFFLIIGKEDPLIGLKHKRWIEAGWTSDPHSIINSGDLFVLPNRETYFDLILLEVLALNKLVLLSKTGGNKFFNQFIESGLFFFENGNVSSLLKEFKKIKDLKIDKIRIYENANKELFVNNFTIDSFSINYLKLFKILN
jgi:glycosyltransferase involved in cell wall biosynthesis